MNINGIGAAGYLAVYGMRETERHMADKNFADEISKAATRLEMEEPDSGKEHGGHPPADEALEADGH